MMHFAIIRELDRPARQVWALVSDFSSAPWLSSVIKRVETEGQGEGMLRRLYHREGGAPVVQRLDRRDDGAMFMVYSHVRDSVLPTDYYRVELEVRALGPARCVIEQFMHCEPPPDANPDEYRVVTENMINFFTDKLEEYLLSSD